MPAPGRHVALLRGINVGGRNKLRMADLRALLEDLGAEDVATYIQSGNAVFSASAKLAKTAAARLSERLSADFGLDVPVVLRTASDLRAVLDADPFAAEGVDEKSLHVAFLADRPSAARARTLEPDRSPPDRFALVGRELFLCCPNGLARTKLTSQWMDARLGTTATVRNRRTVRAILELAAR
jgi:uncharacterized protein (DUF1697 family)